MLSLHPAPGGGMSAIVEGVYSLPPNLVVDELNAKIALAEELAKNPVGLSCGPSSCPCQVGLCGLGSLDGTLDDMLKTVTGGLTNWKTLAIAGAGVAALILFTGGGGSQRRAELTAARAQYTAKVASIRASRPRRYQKYL